MVLSKAWLCLWLWKVACSTNSPVRWGDPPRRACDHAMPVLTWQLLLEHWHAGLSRQLSSLICILSWPRKIHILGQASVIFLLSLTAPVWMQEGSAPAPWSRIQQHPCCSSALAFTALCFGQANIYLVQLISFLPRALYTFHICTRTDSFHRIWDTS